MRPEARFCGTCGKRLGEAAAAARQAEPARPPASAPLAYRSPVVAYTPRHLAEKILRSRSALEGERRQVTVLFADIAGFTTIELAEFKGVISLALIGVSQPLASLRWPRGPALNCGSDL